MLRERKCVICAERFKQARAMQKVCSPTCAAIHVRREKEKADRKETRERKAALKTRSQWLKEAQAALNRWIREVRDAGEPCISCGRHHEGQYHAGHYLARGSHPHLALVEANLAKQCAPCNTHLSGNQLNFRVGLIKRIGLAAVEALEADQTPRKWTIDQLKTIKADYLKRLKEAQCSHSKK
jgi:DNA repair exonuclease SbcCD ATPase subunit